MVPTLQYSITTARTRRWNLAREVALYQRRQRLVVRLGRSTSSVDGLFIRPELEYRSEQDRRCLIHYYSPEVNALRILDCTPHALAAILLRAGLLGTERRHISRVTMQRSSGKTFYTVRSLRRLGVFSLIKISEMPLHDLRTMVPARRR